MARTEECRCTKSYGDPPLLGFYKGQICSFRDEENGVQVMGLGAAEFLNHEEFDEHFDVLYPQHLRQREVVGEAQVVGQFLEHLLSESDLVIAEWRGEELLPVHKSIQDILAGYYGIDQDELEKEKRHMLKRIRQRNEEAGY